MKTDTSDFSAIREALERPFKEKVKMLIWENKAIIKSNKAFLNRKKDLSRIAKATIISRIETLEKQNVKLKSILK